MKFLKCFLVLSIILTASSCIGTPGKLNRVTAKQYNFVDITLNTAFDKCTEHFRTNGTLQSADIVRKQLIIKYFNTTVRVSFYRVTGNTTKFVVKSRKYGLAKKDSIQVVYNDIVDVLN